MKIILKMEMNFIKKFCLMFLLLFLDKITSTGSFLMQCPSYKLQFQKIVGYRPVKEPDSSHNLLRQYGNFGPNSAPANVRCIEMCKIDEDCIGYVLLLDRNQCFGYTLLQNSVRYAVITPNEELIADSNAIFVQKICLNVPENCKSRFWAITRIPGSSLVYQGKKTLPTLVTRRECAERCLFERDFNCLSVSFHPSYKNNHARLQGEFKSEDNLGQCILSDKDKTAQPDAFRVMASDEEYIENDCFQRITENESCSYELYTNSSFVYSEIRYDGLSQKECQRNCSNQAKFYCQGATFIMGEELLPSSVLTSEASSSSSSSSPSTLAAASTSMSFASNYAAATQRGNAGSNSRCYLHSEDLISLGPRSLKVKANSVYMRRVKCLNVTVICSNEEMVITYHPYDWFRGKIYVSSHSSECAVAGDGVSSVTLKLPIGNEMRERKCGILRAYQVKGSMRRTFISALIVIQNNLNVQTQGDRLIKVGCILNKNGDNFEENNLPDNINVGSSLAFTQTELPNTGSLHVNISTNLPQVYMKIIDIDGNHETNEARVGQNLELQIISRPANSVYDIRVTSLIARSSKIDENYVTLIDDRGCPLDTPLFPGLEKSIENDKKILRAKFHAFKFTETSQVNFYGNVQFCLKICEPVKCEMDPEARRNRKRRDTTVANTMIQVKYPYVLYSPADSYTNRTLGISSSRLDSGRWNNMNSTLNIPLYLKLYVHEPYPGQPSNLIYGENGNILISGFDIVQKEIVCIDKSLLIAIIIFIIIILIIIILGCCYLIQKYKKIAYGDDDQSSLHRNADSLDYDSSRRVHWADQGSLGFILA